MAPVGRALLIRVLVVAAYGVSASISGARRSKPEWVVSGRRSVYAIAGLCTGAFVILEVAFLRSDFSFATVASHSSTTTPTFYRAAAAWSSQEGSLLLWVWLLSLWSSLVLFPTRRQLRRVAPYATALPPGFAAFLASGNRGPALRRLSVQALVIHGSADPLVPLEAGRETAAMIPDARFAVIDGMGHALPIAMWRPVIDLITTPSH